MPNLFKETYITDLDFNLLKEKYSDEELSEVIIKIENGFPVQYAIGNVQFLNYKILVDERVLIPRFETELLVFKLINYIQKYGLTSGKALDICTGSGAIAIALYKKFNDLSLKAIDISVDALEVAKKNAILNEAEINFIEMDVLKGIAILDSIDILVSNPPYVRKDEKVSPSTFYEPSIALYPGEDDIVFYKKILDYSRAIMKEKSIIAFEIGSTQGQKVEAYAQKIYPQAKISIEKDYNNFDRYVFIFNNCE